MRRARRSQRVEMKPEREKFLAQLAGFSNRVDVNYGTSEERDVLLPEILLSTCRSVSLLLQRLIGTPNLP